MNPSSTLIGPVSPGRFATARLRRWSVKLMLASVLVAFFPACQGLNFATARQDNSHTAACLGRARRAWQVLQRDEPGAKAAQKALWKYNQSVCELVESLRGREGTNAWGREIQLGGAQPWRVTFDAPAREGSARTLALSEFAHCWLASDVKLSGFERVVAHDGLGVPVVLAQDNPRRVARPFHPPQGEFLPATAVLEFSAEVPGHPAAARLRFYNPLAVSELRVGQRSRVIAENLTVALQSSLTKTTFGKGPHLLVQSASEEKESGLFFLNRYDRSKVPVVFVHGMNSDPSVWKNSVNALFADPDLRRRYQPVCFIYPSKLPVPASAARLRELLRRSRDMLDPGHHDSGYNHLVLVGHSVGGLLVQMQVIDSGTDFWHSFFTATPREIAGKVDAKTARMMRHALFFQRQPNIKLVVFICTPHQGCVVADNSFLRAAMRLILFLPATASHRVEALTQLPRADINPIARDFHDWGVEGPENLSTKHPFFRALATHPVTVTFHSIIATRGMADFGKSSDGIVPYWSAHLEGAASETILPYSHGCIEQPETVQAVMKILKQAK